ncbi:SLAM family member 9-like isoform X3 [Nerophis ophidion]|uniref:SLAM family member 9-like isoform X3 n=1 Tax=Nerophis ophidion TaxID=159077 RepID=UPI002ADFFB72|nr:SLAM family member 9-like isoform X3 [Nerophis ophidion]
MTQQVLVYFMTSLILVSAEDVKYFLKGQDIHFMPSISERPIESIWVHNENEVVWFTGAEEDVASSYKNRITLDRVSAELTIKNATYEDSGDYLLEMNINNELATLLYRIEVIDKVSKPNISCEMSDTKQATLVCSTESKHPHLLKLKWSSPGKEQTGPNLTITVRNEDDDQVYRCDVSNPLTNETASFTAKDCFPGKRSEDRRIVILNCTFILVIICCCILFRKCQRLKVSKERDEKTSFLDEVLTLPANQNKKRKKRKKRKKWNSGLNVSTEDKEMDSEGAMLLTASVHARTSSSPISHNITELSGSRRRSNSWSGIISTHERNVHLKKKNDFSERIITN